ncbi:MotA/TolQ/ExbB proton channel family protein [Jejuia spongiicola]|uniref:MotA/TolQ/ExbB proton channel family protein n=1 Tax=Jejuia spongiicola TaxID=2942207 RepID=A0ABT0QFG7_9FLAO|nr:MotA/TolQ/ExbB proton channel family protein [Jejuia spongiicola]MCL6295193.1 MotA/TolQ/ExbB proton channel family protein [Jejuia spongiicola]
MCVFLVSKLLVVSNPLADRFYEGGPLFMSLILICLLLSIFLLVRGFLSLKKDILKSKKMLSLAIDSSLLGLVLGFLGSIIGLITAFDTVEALGNPDPAIFAGGLKVSLLTATFGLFSFVVSRVGIIVLRAMQNE